jgi:BASS family bile acid:Na+ symporter
MILGLLTGGFPSYTNEIATLALMIAMIFSLTNIQLHQLNLKLEGKNFLITLFLNYGLLSFLILSIGLLFPFDIWHGFVVMAAVPPAIMVAPLARVIDGNVNLTFFSLSIIYVASILLVPLFILIFSNEIISIYSILQNIVLLIVIPLLLSRLIMKIKISENKTHFITNICFFILVFAIMGKNQSFLFYNSFLLLMLVFAMFIRTFGIGSLVLWTGKKIGLPKEDSISFSLFASFKNEGLALLIAFSLFGPSSSIPPVIAIILELLWICCLEIKAKR